MDKYSLQKYEIYRHQMFFQDPDARKPVFGRGSAPDPCGGAYDAPPASYSAGEGTPRAEIPIVSSEGGRSKANMSGFFLKSLLDSPGNLLD